MGTDISIDLLDNLYIDLYFEYLSETDEFKSKLDITKYSRSAYTIYYDNVMS